MKNLSRKNIYLAKELWNSLRNLAKTRNESISELIRRVLWNFTSHATQKPNWENDPLANIIGMAESREGDLSENHDYYLYGAPRKGKRK